MNIKKLFATLSAMVVAVSMTLPSASVFGAEYSQELQDAYNWAYSKGVTTMSPIDNANMYGAITRAEMAKMLSVYSTEVLKATPDTSAACTFSDIDSVKGDLHDYIIESCQLGIMGQGITAFRPYDTISRAEFGTALSRVLWGSTYEGGTPYYAKHLDALKTNAIMNQIANAESTKEIRGYVMLMLMRSETNAVDCDDPVVALACLDEEADAYKECPAACRADAGDNNTDEDGNVVKSGDLAVTASPASERKAIIGAVSDLDTLKFKTSEEVTISKIVLERYGYSKGGDVEKVWLEDEDGNEITTRKAVNSRDQVELSFKKDYKTVDGSVNATIVVELKNSVTTGGTIGFKVISAESTAKNQELDKSWYTPYTYDMVGYDAVKVSIDAKGNDKDYNYEEGEMYEVAKFKLKANTSPLLVNGVNLENVFSGKTLDMKDFLDKVEVLVNGEKIDWVKFSIEKKNKLNISFDSVEVAAKENATFTVNVALAGFDEYGAWLKLAVTNESDVKIQEKKTWARVSVKLPTTTPETDDVWAQHKFVWSKIKLSNNKLWNVEYAAGSSDVVVAEGTITLAESVELKDKQYKVTATYSTGFDIIEEMKLVIAGEEFDVDKSYTAGATGATFTFSDVVIEKWGKFQIKVDLDRDAPDSATVTFDPAFDEEAFVGATYPDGDDSPVLSDEISGTIWFASKLTVQASKASLSNDTKDDAKVKDNETSSERDVLKWKYTAKKGDITLTDFIVEGASWLNLGSGTVTFYLYIDGSKSSVADIRLKGTTIDGSDSFSNVKVKAGESVDVRVAAEVNAKNMVASGETEKDLGKFSITLKWEDDEWNTAWEATRKTVNLIVEKAGSIIIDNTSKDKTLLLAKSQTELASLNVKPEWSATELETLVFTLSGGNLPDTSKLGDYLAVEVDGKDVVEDGYCEVDNDTVTCSNMAERVDWKANIKISLQEDEDAVGDITLKVTQINNDTSVNKEFKKKFVGVLVTFTKQVFGDVSTKYNLKVDRKKSSDEANSLKIYAKKASDSACGTNPIYSGTDTISESNNPLSINSTNDNLVICKIEYSVKNGSGVEITKDEFPDYFKDIPTEGSKYNTEDLVIKKASD